MPYEIRRDHPDCSGHAVVKKGTSKLMGCHPTREKAMAQMRALYMKEGAMGMQNPRSLTLVAADQITDENRSWIEVIPTADKARNGKWLFTITRDDLDAAVASIQAGADRIPVDYDHGGAPDVQGSTRAAGWFTGQAHVIEAGAENPYGDVQEHASAWAEVQWTPAAASAIRDGEFRRISPEWSMGKADPKTGLLTKLKEIVAATLTNRPFFGGMAAVRAMLETEELEALTEDFGDEITELVLAALRSDDEEVRATVEPILAAVWSTSYVNNLPDSSFLYIAPGGSKDSDGRTTPRSLRYFPVKDADGKPDLAHVRNALARIPQSNVPPAAKEKAIAAAKRLLSNAGGTPSGGDQGDDMETKIVAAALGLAEDASEEQILTAITEQKTAAEAAAATTPPPEGENKPKEGEEMNADVLKALGLPEDADDQAVLAKVNELRTSLETTVGLNNEQLEKFKVLAIQGIESERRMQELEREREKRVHEENKERDLKIAVAEGRILPAHTEALGVIYDINPEQAQALIAASPKRSFREVGSGEPAPGSPPDPRVIEDKTGNVIARVADPDWLDQRARQLAAQAGKNPARLTAQEYQDFLDTANDELAAVR